MKPEHRYTTDQLRLDFFAEVGAPMELAADTGLAQYAKLQPQMGRFYRSCFHLACRVLPYRLSPVNNGYESLLTAGSSLGTRQRLWADRMASARPRVLEGMHIVKKRTSLSGYISCNSTGPRPAA